MENLPTYSDDQCYQIYDRIRLPQRYRHEVGAPSGRTATGQNALDYLSVLQKAFLLHIPFENLELHYSPNKGISIEPEVLFTKIISQNTGRGGYCMENNMLFATLLRSLGFDIYMTGARVSNANQPSGADERKDVTFTGLGHQVTIVSIADRRYLVDVGFGNGGPTCPLVLRDGVECLRLPPDQMARMTYGPSPNPENTNAGKVWMYERTMPGTSDKGWLPTYCFPDNVEFRIPDFEVMNHFTSTSRTSFFTYSVMCSKFCGDVGPEGEIGEIGGHITLFGDKVRDEIAGEVSSKDEFKSEAERVEGLEEWLGVRLHESQRRGIKGMVTALPL